MPWHGHFCIAMDDRYLSKVPHRSEGSASSFAQWRSLVTEDRFAALLPVAQPVGGPLIVVNR